MFMLIFCDHLSGINARRCWPILEDRVEAAFAWPRVVESAERSYVDHLRVAGRTFGRKRAYMFDFSFTLA